MTQSKKNIKPLEKKNSNAFEVELYYALKSYGYLFPETIKEVERFEKLYGDTEITIPSDIELPKIIKKLNNQSLEDVDFNLSMNKAAFSSNNDSFNLPGDLFNDDSNESKTI